MSNRTVSQHFESQPLTFMNPRATWVSRPDVWMTLHTFDAPGGSADGKYLRPAMRVRCMTHRLSVNFSAPSSLNRHPRC
jgi:hypothetical protein